MDRPGTDGEVGVEGEESGNEKDGIGATGLTEVESPVERQRCWNTRDSTYSKRTIDA